MSEYNPNNAPSQFNGNQEEEQAIQLADLWNLV